tara:strand:- start:105 stop:440 length:336 start_codon:yes stop_codon:yes gene_type:complete
VYYLFSDNDSRSGDYIYRGYDNFVGIRTKKDEYFYDSSFWSDVTYETNVEKVKTDTFNIRSIIRDGYILVYSEQLFIHNDYEYRKHSPKTAKYIVDSVSKLLDTKAPSTWI